MNTYVSQGSLSRALDWITTPSVWERGRARVRRVRWVLGEARWRFGEQMRWAMASPEYYPPLPLVICPVCNRDKRSVTESGKIVRHDNPATPGTRCEGSGVVMVIEECSTLG